MSIILDKSDSNIAATAPPPRFAPSGPPSRIIEAYYDKATGRYLMLAGGNYVPVTKADLWEHHVDAGGSADIAKGQYLSPVDRRLLRIQSENHVDFVGALAGYRKGLITFGDTRCLITSEPSFIEPKAGAWSLLQKLLNNLFGDVQLPYVLGWIKMALEMFTSRVWMAGQALFIAGPPGAGKNLFAALLRWIFGGRMPGKPYAFMTDKTQFNADFFGAEFLTIEDEAASTNIGARRAFGANLKKFTVNEVQWMHGKHKTPLSVVPLWRVLASLNDEPERLLVVPPLDGDIEDKIMLLLVEKHPMPMATSNPAQQKEFMAALVAELPAFLHYLSEWEIPEALRSDRFGITHYHHPRLADALREWSPEQSLLELIDECIFTSDFHAPWCGRSAELARELKGCKDVHCAREADKLLPAANSCGRYLGRLEKLHPMRVSSRLLNGNTEWRIEAPSIIRRTPQSKSTQIEVSEKLRAALSTKAAAKTEADRTATAPM